VPEENLMHDPQRIYDAMLIKAFRADITFDRMRWWLKPYGISVPDPELKRQPPILKMRVQIFVGTFLKPLADRLWDTDKTQDIKTLNWMANLNNQNTAQRTFNEISKLKKQNTNDRRRSGILRANLEGQKASNQWNVTK
jgi:hypothetical protein